jgi:hypothetical protein
LATIMPSPMPLLVDSSLNPSTSARFFIFQLPHPTKDSNSVTDSHHHALNYRWGLQKNPLPRPCQQPWPQHRLVHERALALSQAINISIQHSYNSACNSYLQFVRDHNHPTNATADTLSFYVIFMCRHIEPRLVSCYLSGIDRPRSTPR